MKFKTKNDKDIEGFCWKFNGWEVVLGAAIVALVFAFLLPPEQTVLLYIACGLGVLWLIGVIITFVVGLVRTPTPPAPKSGGDTAQSPQQPQKPSQS